MDVTNIDSGSVLIEGGQFKDDLITFAGEDTFVAGTILARSTASGKLILFVKGGVTDGNGVPVAVLTYDVTATGAGDVAGRALIAGVVNKGRLVIDADGDDSNIDGAVIDDLRNVGIVPVTVSQLSQLDNQ